MTSDIKPVAYVVCSAISFSGNLYDSGALAAAREEGRRAGLEEAIDALHTLYATLPMERPTIRQEVAAIRALKEKP